MAAIRNAVVSRRPRPAFASRRASERRDASRRLHNRTRRPIDRPPPDPLVRPRRSFWRRSAVVLSLAVLSLTIHVLGVVLAHSIGEVLGRYRMPAAVRADERVAIQVREAPRPPAPEPAAPPVQPVTVAPKALPSTQPPPVDPIDVSQVPPPPQAAAEPPSAPRRRVVGISYESTVVGGGGPALAVGNTRMGQAAPVAADPAAVEKLASSPNQRATVVPASGVRLTKPVRLSQSPPPYPEQLRARGVEADVVVLVDIAASGEVTRVEIVRGADEPAFNAAAERAAMAERFTPATRDDVPIAYTLKFTYRFRLEEV